MEPVTMSVAAFECVAFLGGAIIWAVAGSKAQQRQQNTIRFVVFLMFISGLLGLGAYYLLHKQPALAPMPIQTTPVVTKSSLAKPRVEPSTPIPLPSSIEPSQIKGQPSASVSTSPEVKPKITQKKAKVLPAVAEASISNAKHSRGWIEMTYRPYYEGWYSYFGKYLLYLIGFVLLFAVAVKGLDEDGGGSVLILGLIFLGASYFI